MKTYPLLEQNRFLALLRTTFCALVIAGASLTLPSAEAGRPFPASGNYSPCFVKIDEQHVGQNTIITYSVSATTTGTFTGALIEGIERDVVHANGSITFEGSAIFITPPTGEPCGTLVFRYTGQGNIYTHEESGHFTGGQGTGCLAGIHSVGTFEGVLGAVREGCDDAGDNVSYSGRYWFAP